MKKGQNHLTARNPKELCRILGLPEKYANKLEIRGKLFVAIRNTVEKNKWTREQVAKKTGASQAVTAAIMIGDVTKISTGQLIDIVHHLGLEIKLKVA